MRSLCMLLAAVASGAMAAAVAPTRATWTSCHNSNDCAAHQLCTTWGAPPGKRSCDVHNLGCEGVCVSLDSVCDDYQGIKCSGRFDCVPISLPSCRGSDVGCGGLCSPWNPALSG